MIVKRCRSGVAEVLQLQKVAEVLQMWCRGAGAGAEVVQGWCRGGAGVCGAADQVQRSCRAGAEQLQRWCSCRAAVVQLRCRD